VVDESVVQLPALTRSKYGYLCVDDMVLRLFQGVPYPATSVVQRDLKEFLC
jgi:hypothetical protein